MADGFSKRLAANGADRNSDPFDEGIAFPANGAADGMAFHATRWKKKIDKILIQKMERLRIDGASAFGWKDAHYPPPPKNIFPTGEVKRINPAGPRSTMRIEGKIRNTRGSIMITGA
jgi:hypothetical protein